MRTYLLTDDIHSLLAGWAEAHGFQTPSPAFFEDKMMELEAFLRMFVLNDAGVRVERIPIEAIGAWVSDEIARFPTAAVINMDLPLARSMSAAANLRAFSYSATRTVRLNNDGAWAKAVEGPRWGYPVLGEQVRSIANTVRANPALFPTNNVIVVDDGCYEGKSLEVATSLLEANGLEVRVACAGIVRTSDRPDAEVNNFGFPLKHYRKYSEERLFDWVCLRDFLPFIPNGGRQVDWPRMVGKEELPAHLEICAPYLHGFGDILGWASFDGLVDAMAKADAFTQLALEVAADIFTEIEKLSGKPVLVEDIDRWPVFHGELAPRIEGAHLVEVIKDLRRRM